MTDNPSYRGGQGQGRPADEHYDDRYGRPQEDPWAPGGPEPRGPYPGEPGGYPEQGGYPPPGEPAYPPRGGYPDQGGHPDQGGYPPPPPPPPPYEQRPPAGYGQGGYDQPPYRPAPGGYGGGQPGYGDYGRPTAPPPPGRHEDYGRPEPRPGYGDYEQQGYPGQSYGRPDYGQQDYGRYDAPAGGGYGAPQAGEYEYGQGGYPGGGYGQPEYGAQPGYGQPEYGGQPEYSGGPGGTGQTTVTLQLDDGSGRTYQLREGANVIGRGQDAQFRLPDTGVSRRHLEIRWDGQVALLSDLNSTNGTTVNNAPVQEWQLADGDVIRLGHSEIVVRVH